MLAWGTRHVSIEIGRWVVIPDYHFSVKLIFDRLSVPFVILSFVLCGVIGAFANRYMHREQGFHRFFVCYALFLLGMVVTSLAGTIETLFSGWELVGLSSALLVAFFLERPAPVRNGLYVWVVYRISDAALLIASVVMHHLTGEGDFDKLLGTGVPGPAEKLSSRRTRRWSSDCCCWWPRPANRPWCRFPAGCPGRWKGRRPPAPSSTARCRSTWGRSCCCESARSSTSRSGSAPPSRRSV